MSGEAIRREDALRARSRSFRELVNRTYEQFEDALQQAASPYVAFSGGKDSLVALALCADLRPGITALWTDDELEYPEQLESIPATCGHLGASLVVKTGTQVHGEWFTPWTDRPFWRDPLPGTIITRRRAFEVAKERGHDAVVLGLRAEESGGRRKRAQRYGMIHDHSDGTIHVNPLQWWSVADVWAYIASRELPYSPVYDQLTRTGVDRRDQRVGVMVLTDGWMLRAAYPALHRDLARRYAARWVGLT